MGSSPKKTTVLVTASATSFKNKETIWHSKGSAEKGSSQSDMNPKGANFGMARLFNMNETRGETSRVVGTYRYMAPEYVRHGQFSAKSDVYSLGVMLLEMISGERNKNFEVEGLPAFAWKKWIEGEPESIIYPYLKENPRNEIIKLIQIYLLCVQENAAKRPTMSCVIVWLARDGSLTIPKPTEAGFVTVPLSVKPANKSMNNKLKDKDSAISVDDVSTTVLSPR